MSGLVVDSNIIRRIVDGEFDSSSFALVRYGGVTVHLSDTAATEILLALLEQRIPWPKWLAARATLREILHRPNPILLGGQEGLGAYGFPVRDQRSSAQLEQRQRELRASWRIAMGADSHAALFTTQAQAGPRVVGLNLDLARQVVANFKSEWADEIDDFFLRVIAAAPDVQAHLPPRGDSIAAVEAMVAAGSEALDREREDDNPSPSVRLDAFLRVRALILLRRTRSKETYNPAKNRNDSLDHELLKYLAFPVAVCTADQRLIASVRTARSWQSRWIIHPQELTQQEAVDSITELKWPQEVPT